MLRIPTVAADESRWKRRGLSFERHISTAHYRLSQILETMAQVPGSFGRCLVGIAGRHGCDDADDGMEAVELMGDGRGESRVGVCFYFAWEVVVIFGVVDCDVAESSWDMS